MLNKKKKINRVAVVIWYNIAPPPLSLSFFVSRVLSPLSQYIISLSLSLSPNPKYRVPLKERENKIKNRSLAVGFLSLPPPIHSHRNHRRCLRASIWRDALQKMCLRTLGDEELVSSKLSLLVNTSHLSLSFFESKACFFLKLWPPCDRLFLFHWVFFIPEHKVNTFILLRALCFIVCWDFDWFMISFLWVQMYASFTISVTLVSFILLTPLWFLSAWFHKVFIFQVVWGYVSPVFDLGISLWWW